MDKSVIDNLNNEQRVKIAVAYLLRNKGDRPDGLEKFFKKLEDYEESAKSTNAVIGKCRESLGHLETKFYHLLGSIDTLTDLISDELSDENESNILAWCEKYQPPQSFPNMSPGVDMTGNSNAPANIDMAGATSHK